MKLSADKRLKVKEETLNMAKDMESAVVFTNCHISTDRFHVIKLAMKHIRVTLRWAELDKENEAIKTSQRTTNKIRANCTGKR